MNITRRRKRNNERVTMEKNPENKKRKRIPQFETDEGKEKDERRKRRNKEKKEGRPEEKERSPTGATMNNWSRASERKRHAGKGAPWE